MTLAPDPNELLARARFDLRMGLPVVLNGPQPLVIAAAETLRYSEERAQDKENAVDL